MNARNLLDKLEQRTSVQEYAHRFRELVVQIPDIGEADALHKFISGLKWEVKKEVALKKLERAIKFAKKIDSILFRTKWAGFKAKNNERGEKQKYYRNEPTLMELDSMVKIETRKKLTPEERE